MPSPAEIPAISIRGLSKNYGRIRAVRELEFDVRQGEIFGFLGLNGAGKTTTIRVTLDLVRGNAGKTFILGKDCQAEGTAARALVGYLPGEPGFYADMTGQDSLTLFERLGTAPIRPTYRQELLERFELPESDLQRKIRDYSTGMKRKLGLVQAFQSDAPLLILDEPTEGLDPIVQESLNRLLLELRGRGRTVFMSSHVLSEVERVCDRVGVIRDGRLVLLSTVDDVRRMAPRRVSVSFYEDVAESPGALEGAEVVSANAREWQFVVKGTMAPVVRRLAGLPVLDLDVTEPRLEDVLLSFYRKAG
jgi:ABC-2 type transport system ATP-binding protein